MGENISVSQHVFISSYLVMSATTSAVVSAASAINLLGDHHLSLLDSVGRSLNKQIR